MLIDEYFEKIADRELDEIVRRKGTITDKASLRRVRERGNELARKWEVRFERVKAGLKSNSKNDQRNKRLRRSTGSDKATRTREHQARVAANKERRALGAARYEERQTAAAARSVKRQAIKRGLGKLGLGLGAASALGMGIGIMAHRRRNATNAPRPLPSLP